MSQPATARKNRPIRVWRVGGGVNVAVWEHENEEDGRAYRTHSTRIRKRVKNRNTNEWEDTDYLRPEDLPGAAWAIEQAYKFLLERTSVECDDTDAS